MASAMDEFAGLCSGKPCHVRSGLNVVESHTACVTVILHGLRLLDVGESVDEHRLADDITKYCEEKS